MKIGRKLATVITLLGTSSCGPSYQSSYQAPPVFSGPVRPYSAWETRIGKDPMDDIMGATAFTTTYSGAQLSVFCDRGHRTIGVFVMVKRFDFQSGPRRIVQWRVDDEEPVAASFENGNPNGARVYGDEATKIAKALMKAQRRFVVRTWANGETSVFDARGAAIAVRKVLTTCNLDAWL